jgi:putative FmdB family regulatory protein
MAIYDFKCTGCGKEEEVFVHKITEEVICDECGGVAKKRVFSRKVVAYNDVIPWGDISSLNTVDANNPGNKYQTRSERRSLLKRHNEKYPQNAVIF